MKRHKRLLSVQKGHKLDAVRIQWVTYSNIKKMYDLVYDQMVKAGVARNLLPSEFYYVNEKGEKVGKKIESVGLQVKIEVTHPEWILFGDEVGDGVLMYFALDLLIFCRLMFPIDDHVVQSILF